jgi:integrase
MRSRLGKVAENGANWVSGAGHSDKRKVHSCAARAKTQCRISVTRAPDREGGRKADRSRQGNRWGHGDAAMVLLAYRHGLRVAELGDLRWEQIDLENALLHVRRVKQGSPATQPLTGRELRALRRLQRKSKSPYVFVSERGAPFSKRGFQAMLERAGEAAGFEMKIHPHMLRHACGFKLANDGVDTRTIQAYLGHKSIEHTVRYTELAPTRFKSLFRD